MFGFCFPVPDYIIGQKSGFPTKNFYFFEIFFCWGGKVPRHRQPGVDWPVPRTRFSAFSPPGFDISSLS